MRPSMPWRSCEFKGQEVYVRVLPTGKPIVRRYREDPDAKGEDTNDELVTDLPCPDEAWPVSGGFRMWMVPDANALVFGCNGELRWRYFTSRGDELETPVEGATLSFVGYEGHTLWSLEDSRPIVVDADGVAAPVLGWVFDFQDAVRATPDGWIMVYSGFGDPAEVFTVGYDGQVRTQTFDISETFLPLCAVKGTSEVVCYDLDEQLLGEDDQLTLFTLDLASGEIDEQRILAPDGVYKSADGMFSGP